MDREKLNKAARIERERVYNDLRNAYEIHKDIQHYVTASGCAEKYAVDIFKAGADWLMQQPLSERLADEEKEKIIKKYNFNEEAGIATAIRTGELENKYILMRDFLEDFFGADLFKEC